MAKNLVSNCSYSEVWVHPENWKTVTSQKSLNQQWYVECKFYDPAFKSKYPKGFPYRKKLNRFKTLEERKAAVSTLLTAIPNLFEQKHYNPITKRFMIEPENPESQELNKNLNITDAFELAMAKVPGSEKHLKDVRIAVNRFNKAAIELHKNEIKISELTYGQFSDVFEYLRLPANYFNKFRIYFISIFKVLRKHECCLTNIASEIDKRIEIKKQRVVLNLQELKLILDYLKPRYYNFYRYSTMFFYSGTRSSELFSIQRKHVRIDKQEYDILICKGKQMVWETKVILQDAVPFWAELANQCKGPDDYLFSFKLLPGPTAINSEQISRRWNRLVKSKIAFHEGSVSEISILEKNGIQDYTRIDADFYAIKHSFLDMIDESQSTNSIQNLHLFELIQGLKIEETEKALLLSSLAPADFDIAQKMAAHRSANITNKVYKVGKGKRDNEQLKKLILPNTVIT